MISFEHVTKRYEVAERPAVDDLTIDVPDAMVTILIGPSGSGKSTTMRMVNRLIEPTSGVIRLGGADVRDLDVEDLRRGIGYAIQGVGLFPHWTVHENVGVVPWLLKWPQPKIDARVRDLLDLVGLEPDVYDGKYPDELSGGEAQRVGVARALAADPPVLLMDEPFGAVDPLTRDRLQAEFTKIQQALRKTVVFVTHDIDEALKLGDRIAIMREGRLVQFDKPECVIAYPADDFVSDFVGSERALKRLSLARVAGVASETATNDWAASVPRSATLREALARILETGEREIGVSDESGNIVGSVGLEDVFSHFERPVE